MAEPYLLKKIHHELEIEFVLLLTELNVMNGLIIDESVQTQNHV
jgi:hypothetical protein